MSGCWLWEGALASDGYGTFRCGSMRDGTRRQARAHRVSWELHNGPVPANIYVCHRCDNRACVNPAHLFLGTNADNLADMRTKGRARKADPAPGAKFTRAQVASIREAIAAGELVASIARRYGVAHQTINAIRHGRAWRPDRPEDVARYAAIRARPPRASRAR
jgi:hypothetical protein